MCIRDRYVARNRLKLAVDAVTSKRAQQMADGRGLYPTSPATATPSATELEQLRDRFTEWQAIAAETATQQPAEPASWKLAATIATAAYRLTVLAAALVILTR